MSTYSHELQRMRERPELYFDWQVEAAHAAELLRHGPYEWDCGTCTESVVTASPLDACPKCGAE